MGLPIAAKVVFVAWEILLRGVLQARRPRGAAAAAVAVEPADPPGVREAVAALSLAWQRSLEASPADTVQGDFVAQLQARSQPTLIG